MHTRDSARTNRRPTTLRRYHGPVADELYMLIRPADFATDVASQTQSLYLQLAELLAAEGASDGALVSETLFLRHCERDFDAVRAARRRELERAGIPAFDDATTFIGQPPLDNTSLVELAAVVALPHTARAASTVSLAQPCRCTACKDGVHGRVLHFGGQTFVHVANIFGGTGGGVDEAFDMFCRGEALLEQAGMTFRDVLRTWIHLRDIDRDYDALNEARREFFRSRGIERRPASTGVQGIPCSPDHDFALGLYAVRADRPIDAPLMSTPTLNEAWTYGADFSRGLRFVDANKTTLHVSGTASIDEEGRSVHVGDFAAQAERMLLNIRTLLEAQGAGFGDIVSAITYLKDPNDAAVLRRIFRARGFGAFPCAIVEAPLCRPELLCETEAVAVLPATSGT